MDIETIEADNVVAIKDKLTLITNKVVNTVTGAKPSLVIDEMTLMKCFMTTPLYHAFANLYPDKSAWMTWTSDGDGFRITLHKEKP